MEEEHRQVAERSSWGEYRRLILAELERISREIKDLNVKIEKFRQEDVASMKTDIVLLKFQAAMYGAIAGLVATGAITLAVRLIRV